MKKKILILVLFVLAIFASVTNSYGQTELAPSPGIAYDYAVTIAGTPGATGKTYQFWITHDVNLITGVHLTTPSADFTVNAGATYDDPANTVNHINLTWTLAASASVNPFFLVVKYSETANSCTITNEKVWQIKPVNSFYLAIVPSDATGATVLPVNAKYCVADLVGAIVSVVDPNPTISRVTYTYGKNTLYYKVTAAGMLGTWRPDIQLTASGAGSLGQIYESAQWNPNLDGSGTWYSFTGAAGATPGAATAYPGANTDVATITDAVNGTSILIRIVVDNKNYETLADQAITVGIDGLLPPFPSTTSDVVSATVLTPELPFGKTATNTILARPTETGTTVPFITKNP